MLTQLIAQSLVQPVVQMVADRIGEGPGSFVLPNPTTANYTAAQMSSGFAGSVSTTKTAGRIYFRGDRTVWSGYITGTEAKLTNPTDFGDNPGSMQVAIDGGAFSSAPNTGSVYTLFTGLAHATRFVEVRWVAAMADAPYILTTGTVLTVTGQPPSISLLSNLVQVGANSATGLYSSSMVANSATYVPPLQAETNTTNGSNVGSIKLRGAITKMTVTLNGVRKIGVSKNGGDPIFYSVADEASYPPRAMTVPCDGSTATYNVWDSGCNRNSGGILAVAVDATLLDIGVARRLDQYGDSITYGSGPGATPVDTDTMRIAANIGFVGSTNGISGATIAVCSTMMDAVLPGRTVSGSDVAVLAIGGNNASDGIDSTEQAAYSGCIDKLLSKGYGKVLCRGILPNALAQSLVDAANVILKSVMDGKADARLVWIDPSVCTGFDTIDGTHPTSAGYGFITTQLLPPYKTALGI